MQKVFALGLTLLIVGLCLVQAQVPLTGAGKGAPTTVSATTFDPLNKNSAVILSGFNLIASETTNPGDWTSVRTTNGHSSGKYYIEFNLTSGSSLAVGLADSSFTVSTLGSIFGFAGSTTSVGYLDNGFVYQNSTFTGVVPGGYTAPTGIGQIAYNATTGDVWFNHDNTSWNGTGANPAAGTGGFATGLGGATVYFGVTLQAPGTLQSFTLNAGATAFTYTPPTGFGAP